MATLPWGAIPVVRCSFCLRPVRLTVDESGLCMRCDARIYPDLVAEAS